MRIPRVALAALLVACVEPSFADEAKIVDLSLTVAQDLPCTWPAGWPPFVISPHRRIGPLGPFNSDTLFIDGNCGTQMDVPPHSVPHPDTNLPNASPYGRVYTDKAPAWQFGGEACVIDCLDALESAPNGRSELIKK